MRVKTIREVDIRYGNPSPDAPVKGTFNEGFVLEVEEVTGDPIDDNEIWYRDRNGDYLWSGDFTIESNGDAEGEVYAELVDYNQRIVQTYSSIELSRGNGIKVAVLDTGIYRNHPDFEQVVSEDHVVDFTNSSTGGDDLRGHGTHSTGLIAARTSDPIGIVGVAPECEVFALKVIKDTGIIDATALRSALEWVVEGKIDVVNMSFLISPEKYSSVKDSIKAATESGSILISAAGDNNILISSDSSYPAIDPNVISIGAITNSFLNRHGGHPQFSEFVDFIMPLIELRSTGSKNRDLYFDSGGCSMSTAIVSGLVAAMTERLKTEDQFNTEGVKSTLSALGTECRLGINMEDLILIKP